MVRAICEFDKEKLSKMSKTFMKKAFLIAVFFSVVLIALGLTSLIFSLKSEEINWVSVVLSGVVMLGSLYPIVSTVFTQRKNHRETVRAMQLDKGDLQIDITFKEKKMEVTTTQANEVQSETVLMRNVTKVRANKDGVGIYIGDDMYYIFNDEIVLGTREELIRLFQKLNVKIGK